MWGVIAEAAATMDAGAVRQMLGALIGAGGIGGMGYMAGKTKQISVKMAAEYATKEDLARIENDIAEIERLQRESETKAHGRIDEMAKTLASLDGKMELLCKTLIPGNHGPSRKN